MKLYIAVTCLIYGVFCMFTHVDRLFPITFGIVGACFAFASIVDKSRRG